MKFERRVKLCSSDGAAVLSYVHASEALRMVQSGEAERKSRSLIVVKRSAGAPRKPATPLTPRHYMGKPQHFREPVGAPIIGHASALKRIPSCDRWAYVLSQTDFIAPFRAECARA